MSRKSSYKTFPSDPWWTTQVRKRHTGGILTGIDHSVWLYRRIPSGPVSEASSTAKMLAVGETVNRAILELATITGKSRVARRNFATGLYREAHLLSIAVPRRYYPPTVLANADYLQSLYHDQVVGKRIALLGVKLRPTTGGNKGLAASLDSIRHTIVEGGIPMSDFDKDRVMVDAALARSGLAIPKEEDLSLANSWWNNGSHADVPYLAHGDHLHIFNTDAAARSAAKLEERKEDCATWPDIAGQHLMAFSTVEAFNLGMVDGSDQRALWGASLLDSGATAISIRFKIEPATITRNELRRHKARYLEDVNERYQAGKMTRVEQEETLAHISEMEAFYSSDTAAPTLTDVSCTVAVAGRHERTGFDPTDMGERAGLAMDSMLYRQEAAFVDMMPCSQVRSNPHLHDVPATTVAFAGLSDLSTGGDVPNNGPVCLIGFSERDRQPIYMDAMAAADEDSVPIMLVVGQSGSGKSVFMQWVGDQCARTRNRLAERTPVIMIDLKEKSDFSPSVSRSGGRTISLSDMIYGSDDGVFDGLKFSDSAQAGVDRSHSLLMQANPFGTNKSDFETPLRQALQYGVDNGATCTGQALRMARDAKVNPEIDTILARVEAAATSPIFRAICGFNPDSPGLRVSDGITYIRIGDMSLDLPSPGSRPEEQTQLQRTWLAMVKAMVYGSISACANRQGVVMFDEGWIFLGSGRAEMEAMGRLARSLQVLPVIFTQRTQDALKAELEGYISRGIILPIEDEKEAVAALRLFKIEPRPELLRRITGKATLGGTGEEKGAPNWDSIRALRDPVTGRVLRGTVGFYVDLGQNVTPTEIALSPQFLLAASTNRADMEKRQQQTM